MKTVFLIKKEDIKTSIYGNTLAVQVGEDMLASITVDAMDELVEDYKALRKYLVGEAPMPSSTTESDLGHSQ